MKAKNTLQRVFFARFGLKIYQVRNITLKKCPCGAVEPALCAGASASEIVPVTCMPHSSPMPARNRMNFRFRRNTQKTAVPSSPHSVRELRHRKLFPSLARPAFRRCLARNRMNFRFRRNTQKTAVPSSPHSVRELRHRKLFPSLARPAFRRCLARNRMNFRFRRNTQKTAGAKAPAVFWCRRSESNRYGVAPDRF